MNAFEEYDELMAEAVGVDGEVNMAAAAARVREMLEDAARAGRAWAEARLERNLLAGCRADAYTWWKRNHVTVFRDYNGRTLAKPSSGAVVKHDDAGAGVVKQKLFHDMSWAEVLEDLSAAVKRRESATIRIAGLRRLLDYWERFPESYGPREACALAGTTIEAVLADEAA